jgi:hypothetical protein
LGQNPLRILNLRTQNAISKVDCIKILMRFRCEVRIILK